MTELPAGRPIGPGAPGDAVPGRGRRSALGGPAGLWRHPDFLKLWAGETVSLVGSQVTLLALPLTAVLTLGATPGQMGLLRAATSVPFLVLGLFAGVWVDRMRRRPIMIVADVGRALLLLTVPLAAALDVLRIEQLYAVALLTGVLTLFFDVSYIAFLPSVVAHDQLVEGNSKLATTSSLAQAAGPGMAGALVQLLTAPFAMLLDALSFLISAVFLTLNRAREPEPRHADTRRGMRTEIGEGLWFVWRTPLVRVSNTVAGAFNLFGSASGSVFLLYATRELHIGPAVLGIALGIGGGGAVVGAMLAGRLTRRFGLGHALAGAATLFGVAGFVWLLPSVTPAPGAPLLAASQALFGVGAMIFTVNLVSLAQAVTPEPLLGRMTATARMIAMSTVPLGALLGGALGDTLGIVPTLWVAAAGQLTAGLWLWLTPVRAVREVTAEGATGKE